MAVYVWQQDMDPDFPLSVIEYTALGDGDPMHWHDHFEIALVVDGAGQFMFGKRALRAEPGDVAEVLAAWAHRPMRSSEGLPSSRDRPSRQ